MAFNTCYVLAFATPWQVSRRLSRCSPTRGISQSPGGAVDFRQGWSDSAPPVISDPPKREPRRGDGTSLSTLSPPRSGVAPLPVVCRPFRASFDWGVPVYRGCALSGFTTCLGSVAPVGARPNCRLSRRSPARGISQSPGGAADFRQGWSDERIENRRREAERQTPVTRRAIAKWKLRRSNGSQAGGGAAAEPL